MGTALKWGTGPRSAEPGDEGHESPPWHRAVGLTGQQRRRWPGPPCRQPTLPTAPRDGAWPAAGPFGGDGLSHLSPTPFDVWSSSQKLKLNNSALLGAGNTSSVDREHPFAAAAPTQPQAGPQWASPKSLPVSPGLSKLPGTTKELKPTVPRAHLGVGGLPALGWGERADPPWLSPPG